MLLTRLAVGLEPSNALDAAHRSPRSAPQPQNGIWFPRWIDDSSFHLAKQRTIDNFEMVRRSRQGGRYNTVKSNVSQYRYQNTTRANVRELSLENRLSPLETPMNSQASIRDG